MEREAYKEEKRRRKRERERERERREKGGERELNRRSEKEW